MQLLYFYGDYCRHCIPAEAAVKAYAEETGIPLTACRVDDPYGGHSKTRQYEIRTIPTVLLTDDGGEEIYRIGGNRYTGMIWRADGLHDAFDTFLSGGDTHERERNTDAAGTDQPARPAARRTRAKRSAKQDAGTGSDG